MMTGKSRLKGRPAKDTPAHAVEDDDAFIGPSPNPKTNLLLADIALRSGATLVRRGLERGLMGQRYAPDKARKILKGRTIGETVAGAVIARLAVRSVPGAILVGGGLLAKTLFDRRKGHAAVRKGEVKIAEMTEAGDAQES
jgi:hypothetical protein